MGMVVRTNTMANNAFRQLGMNNSAVSKSLEKLSSGFRINRAGDDASGLAISEKMKAQIKGLEQASTNSQDGISLIQTAEGALTEVHNMLNRMVELATKSANGTIQNEVDRENIQNEVNALIDEIDRIGNATNFNGIQLLDGTMGSASSSAGGKSIPVTGYLNDTIVDATVTAEAPAGKTTAAVADIDAAGSDIAAGKLKVTYADAKGVEQTIMVDFAQINKGSKKEAIAGIVADTLNGNSAFSANFTATVQEDGTINYANKGEAILTKVEAFEDDGETTQGNVVGTTTALDATTAKTETGVDLDNAAAGDFLVIGGKTYEFVEAGKEAKKSGATAVEIGEDADETMKNLNALLDKKGYVASSANALEIAFKEVEESAASGGAGSLTLQIGDTSAAFNKLTVSIGDMRSAALGVDGVDVSSQEAAGDQIDVIKAAINTVSMARGDLGALQNRLEYTINNLDTTAENMTSANSRIRDTDMAKEMMQYTKMNVLVQSAQAMLAQANQQPQSILQLLQ